MNKLTHLSALLLCFIVFGFNSANAQNIGINATGAAPDAGAMLDISATNKGLLIPRISIPNLSSISPIVGSTTTSMLVYNTNVTTGLGYYYWDGAKWVSLSTDANAWKITGNAGTTPGTNFIGTTDAQALAFRVNNLERMRMLTDGKVLVNTTAHSSNDQFVSYGTTNWANAGYNFGTGGGAGYFANSAVTNAYSTLEGVSNYNGTTYSPSAVKGIAISTISTHRAIGVSGVANGRDGIGVLGSIQIAQSPSTRAYGWAGYFIGDVFTTGNFFTPSDLRLKKDIQTYDGAISVIQRLNVVSYNFDLEKYPNAGFPSDRQFGFIAQELKEVVPNAVAEKHVAFNATTEAMSKEQTDLDFQKFYTVDYTKLIPIAIEAIKEQQVIIESQNARIEALERSLQELKDAINKK